MFDSDRKSVRKSDMSSPIGDAMARATVRVASFLLMLTVAGCGNLSRERSLADTAGARQAESPSGWVSKAISFDNLPPITAIKGNLEGCSKYYKPDDTVAVDSLCLWNDQRNWVLRSNELQLLRRAVNEASGELAGYEIAMGIVMQRVPGLWGRIQGFVVGALFLKRDSILAFCVEGGTDHVMTRRAALGAEDSLYSYANGPMYSRSVEFDDAPDLAQCLIHVTSPLRNQTVALTYARSLTPSTVRPWTDDDYAGMAAFVVERYVDLFDLFTSPPYKSSNNRGN